MADMDKNKNRTAYFKKDNRLEEAILDLNKHLGVTPTPDFASSQKAPIILIMGCARSGSTLMLQWLASLGIFSYPSNLIARFYSNPYIGIRAQQALLEYDPLNQIGFKKDEEHYNSSLGKTLGALSPSEFWYFWRQYFKFEDDNQQISESNLSLVNGEGFINQLYAFEGLTKKPLVLKGMILNWNIPYLYSLNNKFLFINLKRDAFYNAQSLLFARDKYFNDRNKWYSFKPPQYNALKKSNPIAQVAGQVVYTEKAIAEGLQHVPEANVLNINYDEFCSNPSTFLKKIMSKYNYLANPNALEFDTDSIKTIRFQSSNIIKLSQDEAELLKHQLQRFSK